MAVGVLGPQARDVDVAVGGVRGGGEGGEHLCVLAAYGALDEGVAVQAGPELPPEGVGLLEAARGAQLDDPVGVLDAEQVGEDPARVVRVVEEEHEVTEADEGVCAVARAGEGLGVAVHVAHDVDPGAPRPAA